MALPAYETILKMDAGNIDQLFGDHDKHVGFQAEGMGGKTFFISEMGIKELDVCPGKDLETKILNQCGYVPASFLLFTEPDHNEPFSTIKAVYFEKRPIAFGDLTEDIHDLFDHGLKPKLARVRIKEYNRFV